jgi:hypothetical protein
MESVPYIVGSNPASLTHFPKIREYCLNENRLRIAYTRITLTFMLTGQQARANSLNCECSSMLEPQLPKLPDASVHRKTTVFSYALVVSQ